MRKTIIAAVVIIPCLVSGCAVVETTRLHQNDASPGGVVYYLPTRPVKIEFVRTTAAAAKSEVDKAQAAATAASEALNAANQALETQKALRNKLASNSPARAGADKNVDLAEAAVKVAHDKLTVSQSKLVAAQASLLNTPDGKSPLTDTMTVTVLPSVADTRHRYSANLKHYATRSDTLNLKTTAAGLLSTTAAKSEDQSAQILVSLAQSLAAIGAGPSLPVGLPAITKAMVREPAEPTEVDCGHGMKRPANAEPAPFKFEYVFDPTAEGVTPFIAKDGKVSKEKINPWEYLESILCTMGADYRFSWQPTGPEVRYEEPPKGEVQKEAPQKEGDDDVWAGLFYRRLLPYRLEVYKGNRVLDNDKKNTIWESVTPLKTVQLELPNASPPELLMLMGTAFAGRDFSTEFQDGLLVSHKEERPSEALSVVSIPYDIAKALVSIPAQLISLKVDYSSNKSALVEAQTKLLQAQKAYEDALKEKNGGGTAAQ